MSKFIEIETSDNITKKNEWLEHCRQQNIPYVLVNSGGHVASVEWDYISYPMGSEIMFGHEEVFLKTELMKIYDKYSSKNSTFSVSASTANFSGFSIRDTKAAADEIFDLIDNLIKNKAR